MSSYNLSQWNSVLKNASLDLMRIIIKHHEFSLKSLRNKETQLLSFHNLSVDEKTLLAAYEQKKIREIQATKHKKLLRDGVPLPCISGISSREPLNVTPEVSSTAPSCIVNLSSTVLSDEEISVLSRGLSFCPATGGFSEFELMKDLDNFARSLRLREYFHGRDDSNHTSKAVPSCKRWTPPTQRDKCLDLYINAVQRDVLEASRNQACFKRNLNPKETLAIKKLESRDSIVIKPADKGGAVVVLNKTDYLKEAMRQLNDQSFYKRLDEDPTEHFKSLITSALTALASEKKLDSSLIRSLIPLSPVAGRFYLLPKIHKHGNPGRPIVSGIGTVTEYISRFVDTEINHIPATFASYVKDTNHFLTDITSVEVPEGALLVTLDVASLYTNIPHTDGIRSVLLAYEISDINKTLDSQTLATLLRLILELNNFEFNGIHYVQVSGTSMGTAIGPNYANIFMGLLENEFLASCALKPLYYKRFIDDIFLIWTHGEAALLSFINDFNQAHPSISFSHSFSQSTINFLDVTLTVDNGEIGTKIYRKPTDRQQYLHFDSSHPKHCKTSIPYSQAIRFKRVCSKQSDFESNCLQLRDALTKQKYPAEILDDAFRRADALDRNDLLDIQARPSPPEKTNLVVTYNASMPNIRNILSKHYNILKQSDRLQEIFPEPPRVVYRRARNLRDILTSSKTTRVAPSGCHPCNKPRCKVCAHMTTTRSVTSSASKYCLKINSDLCCDSENVIYMLECSLCNLQYIGQTALSFRLRFNNHRAHVTSLPHLPLSKHVNVTGHSFDHIKATILQSGFRTHHDREVRESFLIYKFNTLVSGLNESPGKLSCLNTQ